MSLYQNIVCFLVFMVFHKTAAQSTVLAFSQSQIEIVPKQVRNTKSEVLFSNFTLGQLFAVYATLLICLALILECISFILESAGFTHPSLLRLFKRYGVLHFCAVLFIIISAGLWYGYSEHLETTLEKYPKARGSKVCTFQLFQYFNNTSNNFQYYNNILGDN